MKDDKDHSHRPIEPDVTKSFSGFQNLRPTSEEDSGSLTGSISGIQNLRPPSSQQSEQQSGGAQSEGNTSNTTQSQTDE